MTVRHLVILVTYYIPKLVLNVIRKEGPDFFKEGIFISNFTKKGS